MMNAAPGEKDNIYRNELMKTFEFKWSCIGVTLNSEEEGGSDVVSAAEIEKISDDTFGADCKSSI